MLCQLTLLLLSSVAAVDHDLQYVAALRRSQFYRLSELQGQQLLARSDLTPQSRSQIVVEISKTLAAQALNSRSPQRAAFWKQATDVLAEELQKQTDLATQLILRSQQAFVYEQQSAWSVREAELRGSTGADWNEARAQLRRAIKSLKQVESDLSSPEIRRQRSLPDAQIRSIQRNVQFQLGNAYLHQAISYAGRPRDQTGALTQAMSYFRPLAASRQLDDIAWKSRTGQIRCLRLLGQFTQAQSLLQKWSSTAPADRIGSLAAEGVRLALDARQFEAAMQLATARIDDANDPEFQLAQVEAFVAASEQIQGQPRATTFQQQASLAAANLGKEHGTYWALRGELVLARLALDNDADTNMLSTAAETMLRKDAPESAKQMFLKAAEQAQQQDGQANEAFEFLYKAAAVDHREGNLQAAIDQFRTVATRYPQNPKAAEAHLLAVFDAAGLYQQYATDNRSKLPDALAQYEELLREHLQGWPENATADQARIWASKLAMAQRDWLTAIELYQAVTVGSEFEIDAYRGMADAVTKWIAATNPPPADIQKQRLWLQVRLHKIAGESARAALVVEGAKLAMQPPADYALASSLLQDVWQRNPKHSNDVREIGVLLVVAATGQRRNDLAQNVFTQIVPLPPESLLQLLRGFTPIRQGDFDDPGLRSLTLEVIELLKPYEDQISNEDRFLLQRAVADYLPVEQSVVQYQAFVEKNPQDLDIQRRYAELLTLQNNRASRQPALQQWRRVVGLAKKQSPTWFRAKLGVAQAHYDLGDRKAAQDLIRYLATLYPDLGGPELEADFELLLSKARGAVAP